MTHRLASNLFWITVVGGFLLTMGFAKAGSLLASFYHNSHVAYITLPISLSIFLTSLSVLHLALLKRAMRFSTVSANDVVARSVSVLVSIVMGFAGLGYWALIGGVLAQPVTTAIGAFYLCRWIPGLPRRRQGTRAIVRFAAHTYGRFTVNYFVRNVDNLLVGRLFGAYSLGFYKKAYDLFALTASQTTAPLTNVAVSALSRFHPRSLEYRKHLLGALSVLAFVGMALSAEFTLVGNHLIRILLGPRWETAGRIFTFFGPGIGMMVIYHTHGWIHLSIGKADRWFRWGIVEVVVTCAMFLLALPWGADGIAAAWTISFWVLTLPAFLYAGRPIHLGIRSIVAAIWKYTAGAICAGCVTFAIMRRFPALLGFSGPLHAALLQLVVISSVFAVLYAGSIIALHGSFAPFRQLAVLVREVLSLKKPGQPQPARSDVAVSCSPGSSLNTAAKPLVSILIPAFNSEEWIADTLESALAQTWEPKEIIVVDDGSTDSTHAVIERYASRGVRGFTQPNAGAAAARNTAFSLCSGAYIQWLDADDLLAPDKIERQMGVATREPNKRILFSGPFGRFKYRAHCASFVATGLWRDLSTLEWLLVKLGQNAYMQTATWLVSRELAEIAGPWNTMLLGDDDGEYFCRVLLASEGTRFVNEAKVYYRSPWVNTLSYVGLSRRKVEAQWRSMQLHIQYVRSLEDSERVRSACLTYLQTCLIYFYPEFSDILRQAEEMAAALGGRLMEPTLSWKYRWIKALFGWELAKRAQLCLPRFKWHIAKTWDQALHILESKLLMRVSGLKIAADDENSATKWSSVPEAGHS